MNDRRLLRLLILQLIATLGVGYAISDRSVAGIDSVYVVGIVALAILLGTVSYQAYEGYQMNSPSNSGSKP